MIGQEQIDALKAQVNCLRHCLQQARNDEDREAFERCLGRTLATTSDQCLAEVKAKAIEDVANALLNDEDYHNSDDWYINYLLSKAKQLREQAK